MSQTFRATAYATDTDGNFYLVTENWVAVGYARKADDTVAKITIGIDVALIHVDSYLYEVTYIDSTEDYEDVRFELTNADPNVIAIGLIDSVQRIRMDEKLSDIPAKVWAALTDAAKLAFATAVWVFTGGRTVTNTGVITVVSPVNVDTNRATVRRGFDYYVTDNNYLGWSSSDWPDLTGATATLVHEILGELPLDIVDAGETTQTVRILALTATQTTSLKRGFSEVQLKATLAIDHVVDLGQTEIHALE